MMKTLTMETKIENLRSRLTSGQVDDILEDYYNNMATDDELYTMDEYLYLFTVSDVSEVAGMLTHVRASRDFDVNDNYVYNGIYYSDTISGLTPSDVLDVDTQYAIFESFIEDLEYNEDVAELHSKLLGIPVKDLLRYTQKSAFQLKQELKGEN